jgi:enterochelin esterase-like enzyme
MSINSSVTIALSATITVALFALLNIYWSKFNKFWKRFAGLLLLQFSFLISIALVLNNQFGIYNSWDELIGISTQNQATISATSIDLSRAKFTANGSAIIEEKFTGSVSKITTSVWFLIPKAAVQSIKKSDGKKYPVVMFMSGSPGVPTAWLNGLKLDDQIQTVKSESALPDFISVLPDYNIQPHSDTGCMNIPNGVQVEDWLTKDVYDYTLKNLPAKSYGWSITGYSTGGWCSAMLAMKHPEIFNSAAPIAGYYQADFPFKISKSDKEKLQQTYDLPTLAKMRTSPLNLFLITSKGDSSSYFSTNWFYNKIGAGHNIELLTLKSGGHNFTTWRPIVQDILKWLTGVID